MIVTTTESIPGNEIVEILGLSRGSTVRARNVGRDIFAALKNLIGGEINEYTKLQAHSREQALQRMIKDAESLGADAVVNVRITTSMIMQGVAEILAYGTAVKLKHYGTTVFETTSTGASITNTSTSDALDITTTEDSSTAGPVINLKRNSSSVANSDYLGQIKFQGENDADQEVLYAKISGKILDKTDGSEDGILEFAFKKNGSNNISGRFRSDSLQLLNDTSLRVTGHIELKSLASAPSGGTDLAQIYAKDDSSSAEVFVQDEAGNVTKISPHNEKGEWEYFTRNTKTGKTVRVNMEEMIKDIEKLTGKKYIKEE